MNDQERREEVGQWLQSLDLIFPVVIGPAYNENRAVIHLNTVADLCFQFCDNLEESNEWRRLLARIHYYERDCPRHPQALNSARVAIGNTFVTQVSGDYGLAQIRKQRLEDVVRDAAPTLSRLPIDDTVRNAQITALTAKHRLEDMLIIMDRAREIAIRTGVLGPLPDVFAGLPGL